jgi:hypothetical protein
MAIATSNVNTTTDSFQNWIDKTNVLLDAYSTTILTASANTIGGFTTGNATVNGIFTANSITVSGNSTFGLRGGNVVTANVLYITSNVSIGNATVNTVFTTTTIDTDLALTVLGATTLSNTLSVTGTTTLSGNAALTGTLQTISGNSNFDSGVLFVDATNNRVGINNTAPGVALRVTGAVDISATANVQGAANVAGALGLANTLSVTGNTTLSKDVLVVGNSYFTGNSLVLTTSGISVNGVPTFQTNAVFTRNVSVQGTLLTINSVSVIASGNSDLGSNTTAGQLVMSFPKTSYTGAELTIHVSKTNTSQVTKLILTHDSSGVDVTTYGTVVSPASSPDLGEITAAINNANVEIKVQQTNINSAVKIMANLF